MSNTNTSTTGGKTSASSANAPYSFYESAAKHAFTYLFNQAEFGMGCPINVTDGSAMLLSRYGDEALADGPRRVLDSHGIDRPLSSAST